YLAKTTSPEEDLKVQQQMEAYPELKKMVAGLQELAPQPVTALETPVAGVGEVWNRVQSGLWKVAEPIQAWLDEKGQMVAEGLARCLESGGGSPQSVAHLMNEADESDERQSWTLPLPDIPELDSPIALKLSICHRGADWECGLELQTEQASDLPVGFLDQTWVEFSPVQAEGSALEDSLSSLIQNPAKLPPGTWELKLDFQGVIVEIPLELNAKHP
ncbi:MAG: hypothetical protein KDA84_23240, partial [Planctomycetaceae bacterium]|nr:hypothetical protein [Planctomycetaceae bacterium]